MSDLNVSHRAETQWKPRRSIFLKTMALTWAMTVSTVVLLIALTIPYQKASIIKGLHSKTRVAETSIRDVASGALVSEDYSAVVDYCLELVRGDPSILYIVLVRTDGFALIHKQDGWEAPSDPNRTDPFWMGQDADLEQGRIVFSDLVDDEVYHDQREIDYSGIPWGWLSVGLSLDTYRQEVKDLYERAALLLLLACVFSLIASLLYARKLTDPVLQLRSSVERVARGSLSERVELRTNDELESLARSFNTMTGALRDSHDELVSAKDYTENIIQSMSDMLLVVDPEGKVSTVNAATCHRLGYSADELRGAPVSRFIEPMQDPDSSRPGVVPALGATHEERICLGKGGERIPVLLSNAAMYGADGALQGLVCIATDITERKKADAERLAREAELRTLSQALAELTLNRALHEGDLHGAFEQIGHAARAATGIDRVGFWLYGQVEAVCQCLQDRTGLHTDPGLMLPFSEHRSFFAGLAAGRTMSTEQTLLEDAFDTLEATYMKTYGIATMLVAPIRHDGTEVGFISLEQQGEAAPWTGDRHHFAGSLADLASVALQARGRKTVEERLIRRDAILQAVRYAGEHFLQSESWEDGIEATLQRLGEATQVGEVVVYQNVQEATGTVASEAVHAWTVAGQNGSSPAVLPAYLAYGEEKLDRWAEGLRRGDPIHGSRTVFDDVEGQFLVQYGIESLILIPIMVGDDWWGVIGLQDKRAGRDWSGAEIDSLVAAADTLAAAIQKKATQDELLQARDRAEESNRAKSQFLANMSHEIRTPMNGVIGMLKLLRKSDIQAKQRHYVDTALLSADTLLVVINDILDYSRVEAGRLELEVENFRLSRMLSELRLMFQDKCTEMGLDLVMHVDADVPDHVRGDSARLRQVLINLVGNAVKFTSRGYVSVRVYLESEGAEEYVLRLEVSDTGSGLTEEQQKGLFDPFVQGDASTTRKHGGTGLGLAICRQLVQLLGGIIRVDSEVGKGSTFWFTTRLHKPTAELLLTDKRPGFAGASVLLISEDVALIQDMRSMPEAWQFDIDVVRSMDLAETQEREKLAAGRTYDAVLVDEAVLTQTGDLSCGALRDLLPGTSSIVLLDSEGGRSDDDLVKLGYTASITKPIRQSEIYNTFYLAHCRRATAVRAPLGWVDEGEQVEPSEDAPLVLLVEDNLVNREVAREMLLQCGIRCEAVENGEEAVDAVENGNFDMVIMDCQMPVMDGYEATRVLRQREVEKFKNNVGKVRRRLPIVALTAHAMKGDRERCLLAGMDDYMTKPLENDVLLTTLSRWLPAWRPGGTNAVSAATQQAHTETESSDLSLVFDAQKLWGRCSGKQELVTRLIHTYLEQTAGDLERLRSSVQQRNTTEVREIAHRIKGSSANIAAPTLEGLAASLQHQMTDNDLSGIDEAYQALLRAYDEFEQATRDKVDAC